MRRSRSFHQEQWKRHTEGQEEVDRDHTYHVVPGKVLAADVVKVSSAKTVNGQEVKIDASKGVKVDGANVVKTDILCSNGVIHVIDAVILPKE
ncbi:MAG: fasciclin domain-containing protein [Pirellulales bacterium]